MKKFLKVFIIVLFVAAVIGGTVFLFFRNMKKEKAATISISGLYDSKASQEFYSKLEGVQSAVNRTSEYDTVLQLSEDNRLVLIYETGEKLDKYIATLATYYIQNETEIKSQSIAKEYREVVSSKSLLNSMVDEFDKKSTATRLYDRHLGLNDIYSQSCVYLRESAELLLALNNELNIDKSSDLKINMFEVYANIVINNFSNVENVAAIVKVTKRDDIDCLNNLQIERIKHKKEINEFYKYYSACDKIKFAENFAENYAIVTSACTTNEELATYYLKLIYGN